MNVVLIAPAKPGDMPRSMSFDSDSQFPEDLAREDRYVLHNYYRLTNWRERSLHYLQLARARGDVEVTAKMQRRMERIWGPEPPTLEESLARPLAEILHGAAQRILREHPERVVWMRCPKCQAVARTPRARVCLDCGNSW